MPAPDQLQRDFLLAPLTTLKLGGRAEFFLEAQREDQLLAALSWANEQEMPVTLLGGGSNVVIADDGIEGLVIHVAIKGREISATGIVTAKAGENWDVLVHQAVSARLSGFECMSGIPGSVGATPIQNVGAYGQQASDTLQWVRVWDREQHRTLKLTPADCEFSYRWSRFKQDVHRFIVLEVSFQLVPAQLPAIKYQELAQELHGKAGTIAEIRQAVLALREKKSMLIDAADPHSQSVGSFFLNPILTRQEAEKIKEHALAQRWVRDPERVPIQHTHDGRIKVPAAWLIERSGIARGYRRGAVGVSPHHALALVHYGGGTTRQLLELANYVRTCVLNETGLLLQTEPVILGYVRLPQT